MCWKINEANIEWFAIFDMTTSDVSKIKLSLVILWLFIRKCDNPRDSQEPEP